MPSNLKIINKNIFISFYWNAFIYVVYLLLLALLNLMS